MNKNFTVLTLAFFGGTCALFGADPLDDLKKFSADGVGGPAAVTAPAGFTSCEQAALAPLGLFIPPPSTITVPGFTVGQVPFTNPPITLTLPTAPFLLPTPRLCVLSASGLRSMIHPENRTSP